MKLNELFINAATILVLSSCSSGDSKNGGLPANRDFTARDKMFGHFEPTEIDKDLKTHQPQADQDLITWREECDKVVGYDSPSFRVGLRVLSREDRVSLYPELKSEGEVTVYDSLVERIVDKNEFYSIIDQVHASHSLKARFHHTSTQGSWGSELVDIISTKPAGFKKTIDDRFRRGDFSDGNDNYVTCESEWPKDDKHYSRTVVYATMTLNSGQKVKGILVTEYSERDNYRCTLHKENGDVIRVDKIADRTSEEVMDFYSKEFVSPFGSRCHDDSGLLHSTVVRDLSGKRGVISMDKEEVLSF